MNSFLRNLNTHRIFGVSVGAGLLSVATVLAKPWLDMAVGHLGPDAGLATQLVTIANGAAWTTLAPAILAAGYSRPPTIPADEEPTHG